jgi:hypothetical protein
MKHTISRTILAISLALCTANLGLAQNKSARVHSPAAYQSQNHKSPESVPAGNTAGSGSQESNSFACDPKAADADIPALTAEAFLYKASESRLRSGTSAHQHASHDVGPGKPAFSCAICRACEAAGGTCVHTSHGCYCQ